MNRELKIMIIQKGYGCQADLAQQIGMNEDRLSRIIHKRVRPTREEQMRICQALDCEIADVFLGGL
ncbi:MAG: helix-turn-helix domain-containing protein [candidate division Zixibacteria bacterium]|nr:helix-turn-helix domain-containing protein [candidate division Zixibacteria bacterium]